jgi:hypothetical protein
MTTIIETSFDVASFEEKYRSIFSTAETHLKNAEYFIRDKTIEGGVLIPAINELRYAGYHAAQVLAPTISEAEKIEEYKKAIAHCERACFDSLDAQLQFCLRECKTFSNDYKLVVISRVIPNYIDNRTLIENIKDDLKKQSNKESRWQCIEKYLNEVSNISKQWNNAREELNKILKEAVDKRWHDTVKLLCTVIGLLLVGITTIISIFMSFR